jgi:hypothetical protein
LCSPDEFSQDMKIGCCSAILVFHNPHICSPRISAENPLSYTSSRCVLETGSQVLGPKERQRTKRRLSKTKILPAAFVECL